MWAHDGDYLCSSALNGDGFATIRVVDVTGKAAEVVTSQTGSLQNIFGCSRAANRAVVLENDGFTIFSLTDGRVQRKVAEPPGFTIGMVSADTRWLAMAVSGPDNKPEIVDLNDGAVQAVVARGYVDAFSPDGNSVVVLDEGRQKVMLEDWRTGNVLWEAAARSLGEVLTSDTRTDRVYIEAYANPQAPVTRWIVDGSGHALTFTT